MRDNQCRCKGHLTEIEHYGERPTAGKRQKAIFADLPLTTFRAASYQNAPTGSNLTSRLLG
jgi:hypothetical protein